MVIKLPKTTTKKKKRRGRGYGSGKGGHTVGPTVNTKTLIENAIVRKTDAEKYGVKILGNGEINKKLTVELPTSKSASKKIEKAGGKVVKENKT